jgi:transposase
MARTLSQDLRDRVVAAVDGGMICQAAAAHFDVSISSAIRWKRLALQHGRSVAKPRGGDRHSGRIEAHGDFIKELLAEQGDITLIKIQAQLTRRGAPVEIGTVHRFFTRHRITRKKRPSTRSSKTGPTS